MGGRDLSRISFLVADDNDFSRKLVRTILKALRVRELKEAQDGAEALEILRREPVDMVLCDYDMKPMSGLEFIRQVRADRDSPTTYVPIIMLTAYSNQKDVLATRDSGVSDYLIKPYSVRALADRILHVIDYPRPFVHSPSYRGPDRRRRVDPKYTGEMRRESDKLPKA